MELTPWFSPDVKPVRAGCYETLMASPENSTEVPAFSWWDDVRESWSYATECKANLHLFIGTHGQQDKYWRGVQQ